MAATTKQDKIEMFFEKVTGSADGSWAKMQTSSADGGWSQAELEKQLELHLNSTDDEGAFDDEVDKISPADWRDPLRGFFEVYQILKLGQVNKFKSFVKMAIWSEMVKILSLSIIFVAVAGKMFEMTAFEIASLQVGVFVMIQLHMMLKQLIEIALTADTVQTSLSHIEFSLSSSSGNMVKICRSIYDKSSYIEKRMMELTGEAGGTARILTQIVEGAWQAKVGWKA